MNLPADLKDRVTALEEIIGRKPAYVVDYDAWHRGYTPPSNHALIDQLAYRGARVVMASDWGDKYGAVWVVMRGIEKLKPEVRKAIREMVDLALNNIESPVKLGTGSDGTSGLAQCETAPPASEVIKLGTGSDGTSGLAQCETAPPASEVSGAEDSRRD